MSDSAPSDVSDEAILAAFARTEKSPLRPGEVERDLPIGLGDLRDRIDDLDEQGLLRRHEERQSGVAYSLAPAGADRADVPESEVVTDVEAQATATSTGARPRDQETADSQPADPGEQSVEPTYDVPDGRLESFEPPGTADERTERRAAVRVAYEYLRERGRADREDFVADVFPRAPGAYDDPTDGWWDDVVQPGLATLPGAERRGGAWEFDEAAASDE